MTDGGLTLVVSFPRASSSPPPSSSSSSPASRPPGVVKMRGGGGQGRLQSTSSSRTMVDRRDAPLIEGTWEATMVWYA
jgi:hypothetical protein